MADVATQSCPETVSKYWLSCRKFTVQVNVRRGIVVWTAPVCSRFVGQPLSHIQQWFMSFGLYRFKSLHRGQVEHV